MGVERIKRRKRKKGLVSPTDVFEFWRGRNLNFVGEQGLTEEGVLCSNKLDSKDTHGQRRK